MKTETRDSRLFQRKFYFIDVDIFSICFEWLIQSLPCLRRIPEGSFFVKKAVGQKPALICSKVTSYHYYNKEQNYFETCIDGELSKSYSFYHIHSLFFLTITILVGNFACS